MALQAAVELIRQTQAPSIVRLDLLKNGDVELEVQREALLPVAQFLRDNPLLDFKYFSFMLGVDKVDHFETVYILNSLAKGMRLQLRVKLDAADPKVDSVTSVWAGADWHEREAYDMYGITFLGHPYHYRMFLEDDSEGFPMRKSVRLAGRAE